MPVIPITGNVWTCFVEGGINGGGFDASLGGNDFSQQDMPVVTWTDAATSDGFPAFTPGEGYISEIHSTTGLGIHTTIQGNWLFIEPAGDAITAPYIQGGWCKIRAVNSVNSIEVACWQNPIAFRNAAGPATLRIGGALSQPEALFGRANSPTWVSGGVFTGDKVWIRAGLSAAKYNTLSFAFQGADANQTQWSVEGYTTTRGDGAPTQPVLLHDPSESLPLNSNFAETTGGIYFACSNLTLDANTTNNVGVCNAAINPRNSGGVFRNCNFTGGAEFGKGADSALGTVFYACNFYGNGTTASTSPTVFSNNGGIAHLGSDDTYYYCNVHDNKGCGVYVDDDIAMDRCKIYANQGSGIYWDFNRSNISGGIKQTVVDRNTLDGLTLDGANVAKELTIDASAFTNNTLYGIRSTVDTMTSDYWVEKISNNAFFNNGTAPVLNVTQGRNVVTCTTEPWTNGPGGDFSTNDNPGGGALLRGAAEVPNLDIGAEQAQCPGTGGGTQPPGPIIIVPPPDFPPPVIPVIVPPIFFTPGPGTQLKSVVVVDAIGRIPVSYWLRTDENQIALLDTRSVVASDYMVYRPHVFVGVQEQHRSLRKRVKRIRVYGRGELADVTNPGYLIVTADNHRSDVYGYNVGCSRPEVGELWRQDTQPLVGRVFTVTLVLQGVGLENLEISLEYTVVG